jgi:hypothetical protein
MRKPNIDLTAVLRLLEEFRDRIYEQSVGGIQVDRSLYAIVSMKLFGFAFNTYKAIGLLLPQHFYEQAGALYRTLWETAANFEWISRDPEQRSHEFLNFTLIEHHKFLRNSIRTAKRNHDPDAVVQVAGELRDFEATVGRELREFQSIDRKGKLKWRYRFSGPSLETVIHEIGGEWLDEYDRDYHLGSTYAHGAPAGILFPLEHNPELTELWDLERSALMGVLAIRVMIRCDRLWLSFCGTNDEPYLSELFFRLRNCATT